MKNIKSLMLSVVGIITIFTTPLFTEVSAEDKEITTYSASTGCDLPQAFTNAENMAMALADTAKFMELMTLMSKPETMQILMNCSMDTQQWTKWATNAPNPTYKINAAALFMNPQVYMNWMTAMSNPAYYQGMFKMIDPAWQQNASTWMFDPSNYQAALNVTTK